MGVLEGEQVLMRIFIGEADKYNGKAAYEEILQMLRCEKIAGATVLRGIAGFGAKSHMHKVNLLALSGDLPIVIESVDTEENINRVMPKIKEIVCEGLITTEKVHVIKYFSDK